MWGSTIFLLVAGLSQVWASSSVEVFDLSAAQSGGPISDIVGGGEAKKHEFPWQVYLIIAHFRSLSYGGGSLIAPQWVLTAAHCVDGSLKPVDYVRAVVGNHERGYSERTAQNFESREFILHPGHIQKNGTNDIALIKLPQPFRLNEFVQVVRLPTLKQKDEPFTDQEAVMSGYGFTSDEYRERALVLYSVRSKILDQNKCFDRYKRIAGHVRIRPDQICVDSSTGKGICNGDSGGPMVIYEQGVPTLVGVISFTVTTGCEQGFPSVFTRVSHYLGWINQNTGIPIRRS